MHVIPQKKLSFACGTQELNDSFNDPIEKQANGFASGLLMPKKLITMHSDCDINWRNISRISKLCGASLEATYRRLSFLEMSPSALVIHKGGNFKRFVASHNFEFFIDRTPLSKEQRSLIVDIKVDPYPLDFDTIDASDWVNTYSKSNKLNTIYSSTILLNDGYTYTILLYDEDCIADESENY